MDIISTAMSPKWFLTTYVTAQLFFIILHTLLGVYFISKRKVLPLKFLNVCSNRKYVLLPVWVHRLGFNPMYELSRHEKVIYIRPIRPSIEIIERLPPDVYEWSNNTIHFPIKKKEIKMNKYSLAQRMLRDSKPGSRGYWVARHILKSKRV